MARKGIEGKEEKEKEKERRKGEGWGTCSKGSGDR